MEHQNTIKIILVKKEFVEFGHSIQKLNEKLKDKTLTIEDFL